MIKPKLVLISNTSNFFKTFTLNHIMELSKKYKLFVCCKNPNKLKKKIPKNVILKNINFERGVNLFYDLVSFVGIFFFFLKVRPNVSISFTPKVGFMVAVISYILSTPCRIHWYTGQIWANKRGLVKIFFKFLDKIIFTLSSDVLVDSISQRKLLIKEQVISATKSNVFNEGSVGGVNTKRFKPNKQQRIKLRKKLSIKKNTLVFLYLGRINRDKGIIELLEAFKIIRKTNDVLLILVGSIEDRKLIYEFKNQDKILYFNYTNKPEEWFLLSDILCLPSYREGFGTVIIEAASCGIPSLCSKIYGLYDSIIEHKTGFFHKVGSIDDIKKKMLYIIKNKKLNIKYGTRARIRVIKDFKQSLITKKLIKFIDSRII